MALAKHMVEKRLAACANVFPAGRSFFFWEGKVQDAEETIMILKTRKSLWNSVRAAIEAGHPYEVPCITAIDMADGNNAFLAWLEQETQSAVSSP